MNGSVQIKERFSTSKGKRTENAKRDNIQHEVVKFNKLCLSLHINN